MPNGSSWPLKGEPLVCEAEATPLAEIITETVCVGRIARAESHTETALLDKRFALAVT